MGNKALDQYHLDLFEPIKPCLKKAQKFWFADHFKSFNSLSELKSSGCETKAQPQNEHRNFR